MDSTSVVLFNYLLQSILQTCNCSKFKDWVFAYVFCNVEQNVKVQKTH